MTSTDQGIDGLTADAWRSQTLLRIAKIEEELRHRETAVSPDLRTELTQVRTWADRPARRLRSDAEGLIQSSFHLGMAEAELIAIMPTDYLR
jgi:hypothetical protein